MTGGTWQEGPKVHNHNDNDRAPPPPFRMIDGLAEIVNQYDLFLLDMWGVLHNGQQPYEHVLPALDFLLRQEKKQVVIVSNSSQRQSHARQLLQKLHFPASQFHNIITSGEVAHQMLRGDDAALWGTWPRLSQILSTQPNRKVLVLGSGRDDEEYCTSAGWTVTTSPQDAHLLLARGTFVVPSSSGDFISKSRDGDAAYQEALHTLLQHAAQRQLPMLVSNPDRLRPDESMSPMPGAIGDAYQDELRKQNAPPDLIQRIGKPHHHVFALALGGGENDTKRACMVGDALETDIAGAAHHNPPCDSLWVLLDGIHGPAIAAAAAAAQPSLQENSVEAAARHVLNEWNDRQDELPTIQPTWAISHFQQ